MTSNVQHRVNPVFSAHRIERSTSSSEKSCSMQCPIPVRPSESSSVGSFNSGKISLLSALQYEHFEVAHGLVEQGSFSTERSQLYKVLRLAALKNQKTLIQEIFKRTIVSQDIVDDLVIWAASRDDSCLLYTLKNRRLSTRVVLIAMKQAKTEFCKRILLKHFTPYAKNVEDCSGLMKVLDGKEAILHAALQYLESKTFNGASVQEMLEAAIFEDKTKIVTTILQVAELSQNVRDYLVILAAWKNKIDLLQVLFEKPVSKCALALAVLMIEPKEVRDYLWKKLEDVSNLKSLSD